MSSQALPSADARISNALATLQRLVAAVHRLGKEDSEVDRALAVLKDLSRKEGIPLAIIGGVAAIKHGYERFTKDIDVVVGQRHLNTLIRVAPQYGIKVIWRDPHGWYNLEHEGVRVEIVPEGAKPNKDAPTTIPGPRQLGVSEGIDYASLEGWIETKLGSDRRQDKADIVQVLKKADSATIQTIRAHIAQIHSLYLRCFDELAAAAEEEKRQEEERGGPR